MAKDAALDSLARRAAVKERLLDIVKGWYDEVFREQEPQLLPILAGDVEAKRALQATHSPEQLIEMCTGWNMFLSLAYAVSS